MQKAALKAGVVAVIIACTYSYFTTTRPTTHDIMAVPLVKLNNGVEIPAIGLGELLILE